MGAMEKYAISWNNFEGCMSRYFTDSRNREHFLDVTLAAEDADGSVEALRAHKVIYFINIILYFYTNIIT